MRAALFTNTYLPHVGGVANAVDGVAGWLRRRGHACLIVAPEYPGQSNHEPDVVRVPAIEDFNGSGFSFRLPAFGKIRRALEAFGPELIHSHHPYLLGDAAVREARYFQVPLVFTHHTLYEDYVHHVFGNAEPLQRLVRELATEYANLCQRVVAPSESLKRIIAGRGVRASVEVVPSGVDTVRFARGDGAAFRAGHGIPRGARVIGHVGRIESEKNVEFLARAVCAHVAGNADAWMLVVGDGKLLPVVRGIAADYGAAPRAVFGGRLTGQPLVDAYHAMDLFVFSSMSDTQGLVLAEAMAAGLPVIALDAPGARETVHHGHNGLLLPHGASEAEFARAIADWRSVAAREGRHWREAVRRTARDYSLDACTARLEHLYHEVCREHRRDGETTVWEKLADRLAAEWELAASKARAAKAAISKG